MQEFFIGDKVIGPRGDMDYIAEVSYIGNGDFIYATTREAWFSSCELKLLEKANPQTFEMLDKLTDAF